MQRILRLCLAAALAAAGACPSRAAPPPIAVLPDPPARVGRLAGLSGAVSFHTSGQEQWGAAVANVPVTSGDAVWTEPAARAAIDVAGNRLALDGGTELDVQVLDDHTLTAALRQGAAYLHVRAVTPRDAPTDTYAIQTPRGTVEITAPGRYAIVAGDAAQPTLVLVVDGSARVTAPGLDLQVGPNASATLTGADPVLGVSGPLVRTPFLDAMLAAERPAQRAVVARMTGGAELDQYGTWAETPEAGAVWYPQVDPAWAPYRDGRWSWVAPWGWTWVDAAPWGFAPFHYGRWLRREGRWCWAPQGVPGYAGPPVYAPALVGFLALRPRDRRAERPVGWVPLGVNEPYYPPYHARLDYVRRMNGGAIRNPDVSITDNSRHVSTYNRTLIQALVNCGGATVMPASAMAASRPVAAAWLPVPPDRLARVAAGYVPPIGPVPATLGVTPGVARQFRFTPLTSPAAPGPTIQARHEAAAPLLPSRAPVTLSPPPVQRPAPPALVDTRQPGPFAIPPMEVPRPAPRQDFAARPVPLPPVLLPPVMTPARRPDIMARPNLPAPPQPQTFPHREAQPRPPEVFMPRPVPAAMPHIERPMPRPEPLPMRQAAPHVEFRSPPAMPRPQAPPPAASRPPPTNPGPLFRR